MAKFPFEEDPQKFKTRPVIVLSKAYDKLEVCDLEDMQYIATKITSHNKRSYDNYDTIIVKWKEANLDRESVARVSKTILLPRKQFVKFIGIANEEDFANILETYFEYKSNTIPSLK